MESVMGGLKHPNDFYSLLKLKMAVKKEEKQIRTKRTISYSMLPKVSRSLKSVLEHPDELYPLLKLKMLKGTAEKQIRAEPHWAFCYSILAKVSNSFPYVIQPLSPELRDAACILHLVLRALDTIEDDPSVATEIKAPILKAFHRHIYNRDWHFSCGTKDFKVLLDHLHHVRTAFLELSNSQQEIIEDTTFKMGTGMEIFLCKEVETIEDYDEYCHYTSGIVFIAFLKLFHPSATYTLYADSISSSTALLYTKMCTIRDYLKDVNEIPKPRMFWPRQIWSKYVNTLEHPSYPPQDLKNEENSENAIQCLNDMVTNALIHAEDCLIFMSCVHDPTIFKFFAIRQILAFGSLILFYNNIYFFKEAVKLRPGLIAKVIDRTKSMADVYQAFYDFSLILMSKIDMKDPNAKTTITRIEAVQKICRDSGTLFKRKSYLVESNPHYN